MHGRIIQLYKHHLIFITSISDRNHNSKQFFKYVHTIKSIKQFVYLVDWLHRHYNGHVAIFPAFPRE